MKLTTELIALCDYAIVSQQNKISINGIFDFISIEKFPGGLSKFYLVATFKGLANSAPKLVITVSPDPIVKKPFKNMGQIKVGPNGKSNLVLEINGLSFEKAGTYEFRIEQDGELISSIKLDVVATKQKDMVKSVN